MIQRFFRRFNLGSLLHLVCFCVPPHSVCENNIGIESSEKKKKEIGGWVEINKSNLSTSPTRVSMEVSNDRDRKLVYNLFTGLTTYL